MRSMANLVKRRGLCLVILGGACVTPVTAQQTRPATKEQIHEAMQYVPDDFVLTISATGTPDEVKKRVQEYVDRGCTCPILYPMADPYLMIDTFATV